MGCKFLCSPFFHLSMATTDDKFCSFSGHCYLEAQSSVFGPYRIERLGSALEWFYFRFQLIGKDIRSHLKIIPCLQVKP
jgi:hypothetical protein